MAVVFSLAEYVTVMDSGTIMAEGTPSEIENNRCLLYTSDAADEGLGGKENQIAGTLPYGHQKLLEVAMSLAADPELLILDEPTQGLAQAEIENLIALIRDISKSVNVLLIEHNMAVVFSLAEYVTVMDSGEIMAEGTPSEIENNREVQDLYLGN